MSMSREDNCELFYPEIMLMAELMKKDKYFRYCRSDYGNDEDSLDIYTLRNSFNKVTVQHKDWNKLTFYITYMYNNSYYDYHGDVKDSYEELSLEETVEKIINFTQKLNHPILDIFIKKLINKGFDLKSAEKIGSILIKEIYYLEESELNNFIEDLKFVKDGSNTEYLFVKNHFFIDLSLLKEGVLDFNNFNYNYNKPKNIFKENIFIHNGRVLLNINGDYYSRISEGY